MDGFKAFCVRPRPKSERSLGAKKPMMPAVSSSACSLQLPGLRV